VGSHGRNVAIDGEAIAACYTIHMKRTNLVLNEEVLKEATRILGAKTYSEAVNTALQEVVRRNQVQSVARFFGTGIWKGDLSEMREDRSRRRPK